jgi:hypothetical protein
LAGGDGAESNQKLVVHRLGIVENQIVDFLNAAFAVVIEEI